MVIGVLGYYIFKNIYIASMLVAIIAVITTFYSILFWATLYTQEANLNAILKYMTWKNQD